MAALETVEFRKVVVARTEAGKLLIALFDGDGKNRCVDILTCTDEAATALVKALGSALKGSKT